MNLHDIPESLQGHFEQTPEVLGGKLRVRGTRISVEQVLELLEAGSGPEDIAKSYPSLTQPDVSAVERLAAHCALSFFSPFDAHPPRLENVPVDLVPFLRNSGHVVESVNYLGWKGMKTASFCSGQVHPSSF